MVMEVVRVVVREVIVTVVIRMVVMTVVMVMVRIVVMIRAQTVTPKDKDCVYLGIFSTGNTQSI